MNSLRTAFTLCLIHFTIGSLEGQTVANYTFSATNGAYAIIQSSPGSTSPALSGGSWDDGWFNAVPIGFTFVYEGVGYTTMAVSSNGWAKFGSPISNSVTLNNISTGTVRPMVAPLWDDIMLPANGFTYITTGVAPNRICTLEWYNARWNYTASAGGISFQVKLYESNKRVEFIYRQEGGPLTSPSASIGIGGVLSGQYISLNGTGPIPLASTTIETTSLNVKPVTGQTYRFDHYKIVPTIISVSPISGMINSMITISGTGFDPYTTQNIVHCGAVKANVFSASTTQLLVTVPVGTDYKYITVTLAQTNLTAAANQSFDATYSCGGVINTTTFAAPFHMITGVPTRPIHIQDIDGDGKSEIIAGSDLLGGVARVYQNNSTVGSFTSGSLGSPVDFIVGGQPGNIVFSDVDGDGKKDMVVACYDVFGLDSVTMYRNTSTTGSITNGSFGPPVDFRCGPYPGVSFADINSDGKPDMILSCRSNNTLEVRTNQSVVGSITTASFGPTISFTTALAPQSSAVGDIDGDGKADVITTNNGAVSISVFRNTGITGPISTLSLAPKVDFPGIGGPGSVKVGDIDGDGQLDVVCADVNGNSFSVFRNTSTPGTISFAPRYDRIISSSIYNIDLGDIDGDGKVDVSIANASPVNRIGVSKNNSTPGSVVFAAVSNYAGITNPFGLAIGDLDNDHKPEAVAGTINTISSSVSILYNTNMAINAIAPATVLSTTSFCDNGTWKNYYNPADITKILFAVKDNGNNLGTITVDEYRDIAPGTYNGQRYLQRHFRITPTFQPSTPVQIRLYFTSAELTNLMGVDPNVTSVASLSVTQYEGPTEDGIYNPLDASSLVWYPQGAMTPGIGFGGRYLEFTTSSFSEFWIHGSGGVLPIELLSFEAHPVDQHVELIWETASEINNDFFTIEKTKDGSTIYSIDTIDGAGNSTTNLSYTHNDMRPFEGSSYYRLKQTDFDGQNTYSEWREVSIVGIEHIDVFPNPSAGDIVISLPREHEVHWELRIKDMNGQLVYVRNGPKWDMQKQSLHLADGTYVMHLASESTEYCQKIVMVN